MVVCPTNEVLMLFHAKDTADFLFSVAAILNFNLYYEKGTL